jgi:hypothetical protein
MRSVFAPKQETQAPDRLTETIVDKLNNPSTSSDFDFHEGVNQVLADVGMSAADSGGKLTFYGQHQLLSVAVNCSKLRSLSYLGLRSITLSFGLLS